MLNQRHTRYTKLKKSDERQFRSPRRADPYRADSKPAGVNQCPHCHSVNIRGKWLSERQAGLEIAKMRKLLPFGVYEPLLQLNCPACLQQRDHYAQGVVEIRGTHWRERAIQVFETLAKTELISRVRNDQERILWTNDTHQNTKIYVTLPELARQMGRILQRSFKGKTHYIRSTEEPFLRVVWDSDGEVIYSHPLGRGRARGRKAIA